MKKSIKLETAGIVLAFSYIRFSDKKQAKGGSILRQTELATAWAERNGVQLDHSTYQDLGVSAFTAKHRENADRNGLAMFLKAVEENKVPKGSFLIVESLDRLTREDLQAALMLCLSLLQSGIRIVQLTPVETVYTDKSEMAQLMLMIVELSRGNSESAVKSHRIKENWDKARENVRKNGNHRLKSDVRGLPGRVPFWLDRDEDGYTLNDKAEAVRRMYELCKDGMGANAITNQVNREFGLKLSRPYVRELLPPSTKAGPRRKGRVVLGEWQPYQGGKKMGEVVQVYPAAISEDDYYAAQLGVTERDKGGRTRDRQHIYLFNRLMVDEHGGKFTVSKTTAGRGRYRFIPQRYLDGLGPCVSFPVEPFEDALFACLKEIDPREVLPKKGRDEAEEVLSLMGKKEGLLALISQTADTMDELGKDVPSLVKKISGWEDEVEALEKRIAELKQRIASPQSEAWGELGGIMADKIKTDPETRIRFRAVVSRIVERLTSVFHGTGTNWRFAFVQVRFKDSAHFRQIVVWHRATKYTFGGTYRPDLTAWDTWREKTIPENSVLTYLDDIREYLEGLGEGVEADEREERLAKRRARRQAK